jgi:hypothetical protein
MPHAEASIATATSRSFWPPDSDFGADIPSGKHDSREAPVPGRFPSG